MRKNYLSYPVELVNDVFGEGKTLAAMLEKAADGAKPKLLIVADLNVVQRNAGLGSAIGRWVKAYGFELADQPLVLAGGEKLKTDSLLSTQRVVSAILSARLGRKDAVIAIGGGTLFDLVGYVAPQVRGGVGVLRIPTTPAAMLDAVYSENGALDFSGVKDAIRVPSVPMGALIDCTLAATVLDGVWNGGFGEAVRIATVLDKTLFAALEKAVGDYRARKLPALEAVVRGVLETRKAKGGSEFAEWLAIRLEALSNYQLPHGYSVPIGVMVDTAYAAAKGHLKSGDRERIEALLTVSGAIEGWQHSRSYLGKSDELLQGLDAWRLAKSTPEIVLPAGIGKSTREIPDRETYRTVFADCHAHCV